jgi:hypothetical protein
MRIKIPQGTQYQISKDGSPRRYCDRKDIALQTARFLKSQSLYSTVTVKDLQTGEEIIVVQSWRINRNGSQDASPGRSRAITLRSSSGSDVGLLRVTAKRLRKYRLDSQAKGACTLTISSNISVEFSARNKLLIAS